MKTNGKARKPRRRGWTEKRNGREKKNIQLSSEEIQNKMSCVGKKEREGVL